MRKLIFVFLSFVLILLSCRKDKKVEKAGVKMQSFIQNISCFARQYKSDFIVIPQNGIELAFNDLTIEDGVNTNFLQTINGFGIEELFYNGDELENDGRLEMCRNINGQKKILVSDYTNTFNGYENAKLKNNYENFLSFPRSENNYDYQDIPIDIQNENSTNILTLEDAKNYLYLISSNLFLSKSAILEAIAATNFDAVILDLFFEDEMFTKSDLGLIRYKANGGKRLLISYMSIGSAEKYRYYWKKHWARQHPIWLKRKYEGYKDEFWVNFWHKDWKEIIYGNEKSYTKKILDAGFDGVYLDNVEAYYFLYRKN